MALLSPAIRFASRFSVRAWAPVHKQLGLSTLRSSVTGDPSTNKALLAVLGVGCSLATSWALSPGVNVLRCEALKRIEEVQCKEPKALAGKLNKVSVPLEDEVVQSLPVMSLEEVRKGDAEDRIFATYEGIVYDITAFADHHPGGRELVHTAAGLDLIHFFENYTVHMQSDKAANWLAPLAVGRLSEEDAARSVADTTPEKHVQRRMRLINRARSKVLVASMTLPLWFAVRSFVRLVHSLLPSVGRWLASRLPVTVPGVTPGSEPMPPEGSKVAVIGGGIAGCSAAWALAQSGYEVILYEARQETSGNARTFLWDGFTDGRESVKSCVSVTAWPPLLYKNYTALLEHFGVETTPMPLSWFLNSKVPGCEGFLWAADPSAPEGSLRQLFAKDFKRYESVLGLVRTTTDFFTMSWAPWKRDDTTSMYSNHTGLGMLNPCNIFPLYNLCRLAGISKEWWEVIFQPHYTASFLVDELKPFPAVFGPIIEAQIPLIPTPSNSWQGASDKGPADCKLTTCVTWKDAGVGLRDVFGRLTEQVTLKTDTRVVDVSVLPSGKKLLRDEFDASIEVDRVIFACPCNAVGNILKSHGSLEDAIFSTPVYADDHHPATGHMHAVMHSDASVIAPEFRQDCLRRASNYVEITRLGDGTINVENQYNFGVQTPGPGVYDLPLDKKPVMLISHALGDGKSLEPSLVRGSGNHARAHPLYSGWNVQAMLALRLVQGRDGVYYCSNWTTPGNCHDMSLLSGFICAHAIGAAYPFPENKEATKDFHRLRDLMGV